MICFLFCCRLLCFRHGATPRSHLNQLWIRCLFARPSSSHPLHGCPSLASAALSGHKSNQVELATYPSLASVALSSHTSNQVQLMIVGWSGEPKCSWAERMDFDGKPPWCVDFHCRDNSAQIGDFGVQKVQNRVSCGPRAAEGEMVHFLTVVPFLIFVVWFVVAHMELGGKM